MKPDKWDHMFCINSILIKSKVMFLLLSGTGLIIKVYYLHRWSASFFNQLIFEPDQFSKFGIFFKSVSQTYILRHIHVIHSRGTSEITPHKIPTYYTYDFIGNIFKWPCRKFTIRYKHLTFCSKIVVKCIYKNNVPNKLKKKRYRPNTCINNRTQKKPKTDQHL